MIKFYDISIEEMRPATQEDWNKLFAKAARFTWQSMETAPRDGTKILIHTAGNIYIACFEHGSWRNNHYGAREKYWHFSRPQGWMPLPEVPNG